MTLFNLGYQMIGPAWEWQRADIEKEDAVYGLKTVVPFCVDSVLWDGPEVKPLVERIRFLADPPLGEDCLDWIEMLMPAQARGLRWEAVVGLGYYPLVRYAHDTDVRDAADRRRFNLARCRCYEVYDPQVDPCFMPLGYDLTYCTGLFLSGLYGWANVEGVEWKKRHAHGINKWHLFEDYAHAKTACCELNAILEGVMASSGDVEDYPFLPVAVGLERHVYASLQV